MKNNTTKSVILAPFNSTKSHISEDFYLNDSVQEILVSKSAMVYEDKCKEINRQYMLNNNAELDNGVYNENEQENKEGNEEDDGLMGLNQQIENKGDDAVLDDPRMDLAPAHQGNSGSNPASGMPSNIHSLNTS